MDQDQIRLLYVPLREHLEKIAAETDRRHAEVAAERDRRYAEVHAARKELSEYVKEIQNYKNEQANELRKQIESERGLYASKDDLIALAEKIASNIDPLAKFVATQQGGSVGRTGLMTAVGAAVALALGLITLFAFLQPPDPRGSGRVTVESSGGGRPDAQLQVTPE